MPVKTYFCEMASGERRQFNPQFFLYGEPRVSVGDEVFIPKTGMFRIDAKKHKFDAASEPESTKYRAIAAQCSAIRLTSVSDPEDAQMETIAAGVALAKSLGWRNGVAIVGSAEVGERFFTWKATGRTLSDYLTVGDLLDVYSPKRRTIVRCDKLVHVCGTDSGYLSPYLTLAWCSLVWDNGEDNAVESDEAQTQDDATLIQPDEAQTQDEDNAVESEQSEVELSKKRIKRESRQ